MLLRHASLLTPWPGRGIPADKDAFNFWQSNSRITIECSFGILAMRWGIFWRPINTSIAHSVQVVQACMVLHNMCIDDGIAEQPVEIMRGDGGGSISPLSACGSSEWPAADPSLDQGRRRDLERCPLRVTLTAALADNGMVRPARSTFRY